MLILLCSRFNKKILVYDYDLFSLYYGDILKAKLIMSKQKLRNKVKYEVQ